MKRFFTMVCLSLLFMGANAQDKNITMEDAIINRWRGLAPETLIGMQWRGDLHEFTYTSKDYSKIINVNTRGKEKTLLSLKSFNKALLDANIPSVRYIYGYKWISKNVFRITLKDKVIEFDVKENKVISITKALFNKNLTPNSDRSYFAYTKANNLFIKGEKTDEIQITNDSDKNIVNGTSVSRNEFGIDGGIFWSPKGNKLAFYRKDESAVSTFPLVDISTRTGTLKEIKYPMAGMDSEHISLGVYDLKSKKTIWVKADDFSAERYLTNISWDLAGKYIYIQVLNREQNHMKLNKYDAATGEFVATIHQERDSRYVEPQHKLIFLKSNPSHFIYQSNTLDGYNNLYIMNTDGKIIKNLTPGTFDVDFLCMDSRHRDIYYMSREIDPRENHLYKVNIKSGRKTQLTSAKGWHTVYLTKDRKYFIDKYSNVNTPNVINIVNKRGKVKTNILKAKNPIENYTKCKVELGTLKANDKTTDLYYKMTLPANFDSSKKYPVILYVYGGPHAQLVKNTWQGANWDLYMAQRGYIVFTLDNRGSAGRGKEFEACIHRNCGQLEMQDQMTGINYLKSKLWVDANRIGVHGWSYGGFMTISLITNYPDTFKVAVAGGPVIDWKWYEAMYGERYMDTPKENPEGYKKVSLLNQTKNLKGKLLIIQGAIDKTVLWQHSLNFVRQCIMDKVQLDYFPYPRAEHNVRGIDRIHLKDKCANYFFDYLK